MKFYRYEIEVQGDVLPITKVRLREFILLRETPQGYWITIEWMENIFKKWVSKTAKRRFAYPTKQEALTHFKKRTEKRIKILENQLGHCKSAINIIETL